MNNPLLLLLLTGAGVHVARLWLHDLRAAQAGRPHPRALPGAAPAPGRASVFAAAGALVILAAETAGEIQLGIASAQSRMTWLAALYSIVAAPVIEEFVFRGWLVIEGRGPRARWAGALAASAAFAALHPFLWRWDDAGFALTVGVKGAFSTVVVFATSLWLYAVRFAPWNPQGSLLPCVAGHAAKNAGVVAVKAATGFMDGLW